MDELTLDAELLAELEDIYHQLQVDYEKVAAELQFSCEGCPDNCCDSYFLHHTYAEWIYLWMGIKQLSETKQKELVAAASEYLKACEESTAKGERPQVMCPLNDNGLCVLYKHRLLVCRTHGVPARLMRPDGQTLDFPGCFRCQELTQQRLAAEGSLPRVERTALLRRLAMLENKIFDNKRHLLPKVKMTIAEMIVSGPPQQTPLHCKRPGCS